MSFNSKTTLFATAILLSSTMLATAHAQSAEVAVGGGLASYHGGGDSSNKGIFTVSGAYNINGHIGIGAEYGYSPLDSISESDSYGDSVSGSSHLSRFGAVGRFSYGEVPRVAPYFLVAVGGLHESASATASSGGYTASASASENGSYVGFGVGGNIYIKGNLGVRPEVRYQHLDIDSSGTNEFEITGSIFYTFGKK